MSNDSALSPQPSVLFVGATETVTGSRFVLDAGGVRVLLDCGLYQGSHDLRERNWRPFPVPPRTIDAVVLSHAHIDHTGYLPRLVRDGFDGPVYASAGTRDLCSILLPDAARMMEEEAEYRNRKGATHHQPALPLYTEDEAAQAVSRIRPLPVGRQAPLAGGGTLTLRRAGHLLGSSLVEIALGGVTLLFSGDLGRPDPTLLAPREVPSPPEYLLLESTYGNRLHHERDPRPALEQAVRAVAARRGVLVIPAFAVGRCQELLFLLRELEDAGRIPVLPVAVDSPMATDATRLYERHGDDMDADVRRYGGRAFRPAQLRFTRSVEESKELNVEEGPAIIISASGMATGGRVLHHLSRRLPDPRNLVLIVGYQAQGTPGRLLQDGADRLRIFKDDVRVRATVMRVDALSAHADADELVGWLRAFSRPPRRTFLVHGEDNARDTLAARIRDELGWDVAVPEYGERAALG
jgi:metallo-beta-lactamase family protein